MGGAGQGNVVSARAFERAPRRCQSLDQCAGDVLIRLCACNTAAGVFDDFGGRAAFRQPCVQALSRVSASPPYSGPPPPSFFGTRLWD
jgi:hypothetical protein